MQVQAPENLPDIRPDSIQGLRFVTQERAREITGKSAYIVRRWATKRQPIDVTSLRLLQIWVWGIIPSEALIKRGIRVCHEHPDFEDPHGRPSDVLMTMAGYPITPGELEYFGWLREQYSVKMAAETAQAPEKPKTAEVINLIPYIQSKRHHADEA